MSPCGWAGITQFAASQEIILSNAQKKQWLPVYFALLRERLKKSAKRIALQDRKPGSVSKSG